MSTEDFDETDSVESGSSENSFSAKTGGRARKLVSGSIEERYNGRESDLSPERPNLRRAKRRKLRHSESESAETSEDSEDDGKSDEFSIFSQLGNVATVLHSSPISSQMLFSSVVQLEALQMPSARFLPPKGTWAPSTFPRLTPSQVL